YLPVSLPVGSSSATISRKAKTQTASAICPISASCQRFAESASRTDSLLRWSVILQERASLDFAYSHLPRIRTPARAIRARALRPTKYFMRSLWLGLGHTAQADPETRHFD